MANMDTENYCFCELAPLYALDLLNEQEKGWVEQQVVECPDLAEELAGYEAATTAIPYTSPALPIVAGLKNRLFDQLGLDTPSPAPSNQISVESLSARYSVVRSQDLNWQPYRAPGVMVAIVHADEVTREVVGFLRAEPGASYPFHRHVATEELFMMEGDLVIGDEIYGPGDYIRSLPGSSHAPYTNGGCRFFFRTSLDTEYPEVALTN